MEMVEKELPGKAVEGYEFPKKRFPITGNTNPLRPHVEERKKWRAGTPRLRSFDQGPVDTSPSSSDGDDSMQPVGLVPWGPKLLGISS